MEPKQQRSRQTLTRLLDAAEALLDENGLDAATVPAIAERAGVSVGVVYRRFRNKDELLRAVYERFFQRALQSNRTAMLSSATLDLPFRKLARAVVQGIVRGQRMRRNLLVALRRYAETHRDPAFRREAADLNREGAVALTHLLLRFRDEIHHPDPEKAIHFALLTIGAVLYAVLQEDGDATHGLTPPENLEHELTRMFFTYLGISDEDDDEDAASEAIAIQPSGEHPNA